MENFHESISSHNLLATGRKTNVYKTSKKCEERFWNSFYTSNLHHESREKILSSVVFMSLDCPMQNVHTYLQKLCNVFPSWSTLEQWMRLAVRDVDVKHPFQKNFSHFICIFSASLFNFFSLLLILSFLFFLFKVLELVFPKRSELSTLHSFACTAHFFLYKLGTLDIWKKCLR